MPREILSSLETDENCAGDCCTGTIFESKEHMNHSLSRLCYGNLYTIGSIWIEGLKNVLTGSKMCLIPTVEAAAKKGKDAEPEPPKKPGKMKYSELPLYAQPFREYQEYVEDQNKAKCNPDVKIIHNALLPYVGKARKQAAQVLCLTKHYTKESVKTAYSIFETKKKELKTITRDPKHERYRQAAVGVGAATGLFLARKKGLPAMVLYTSIGVLTTGWLCFPKETDREFRKILWELSKASMTVFNYSCGMNMAMPGFGPCESQKPPLPEPADPKAKKNPKKEEDPCKEDKKKKK